LFIKRDNILPVIMKHEAATTFGGGRRREEIVERMMLWRGGWRRCFDE
jgi:hypothetical protein